jgi:hypothetical protein
MLQANNVHEQLDLVDLEFSDMTMCPSYEASQRSWAKRSSDLNLHAHCEYQRLFVYFQRCIKEANKKPTPAPDALAGVEGGQGPTTDGGAINALIQAVKNEEVRSCLCGVLVMPCNFAYCLI